MTEKEFRQLSELPTWLSDPNIIRLFDCLEGAGITGRFVGGCVRDHLIGRPVNDFDIAVDQVPEKVVEALEAASIKAIPTGLSHGTVTAVVNHQPFELTTLRKDIETDGRHAIVEFTDDWQEDAARRDFTMNALYLDRTGKLYDYFNGREDAETGYVRFVGDPELRMEEDALRLLRYFRFSAYFSTGVYDKSILEICKKFSPKLQNLASERIWQEWAKILTAKPIGKTLQAMNEVGIFDFLYRKIKISIDDGAIERSERLNTQDCHDPIVSLAALHWDSGPDEIRKIDQSLRLSNKESTFLNSLFIPHQALASMDGSDFFSCYAMLNAKVVQAICKIELANGSVGSWDAVWQYADATGNPVFPLQGRDLLNKNIEAGPQIGRYLSKVKKVWIETGFKLNRADCLVALEKIMEES